MNQTLAQSEQTELTKLKLTHWRRKRVNEMSKEELIEALSDAHHLWRQANERGIQNIAGLAENRIQRTAKKPKGYIKCLNIP